MTLVYLGIGWLVGLALAAVFPLKGLVWLGLALPPLAAAFLQRQQRSRWRLTLALALVFLGAARYRAAQPVSGDLHLANGQGWGEFEGYVAAEPDPRADRTQLIVRVSWMQLERQPAQEVSGRALLIAPPYSPLRYGDRLRFAGRLATPPEYEGFDYRAYLARQDVHSMVYRPQIEPLQGRSGSILKRLLFDWKASTQVVINELLPDPEAALLSGILLGNEQGISASLEQDFRRTGAAHIIAISGFNISLLISLLSAWLGPWLPRRTGALLTIAVIALYTLFVGAEASVLRAAIMGSLLIAGRLLGRKPFLPASLMAAAVAMTLFQPGLLEDLGFQLSFAATLSLALFAEPLHRIGSGFLSRFLPSRAAGQALRLVTDSLLLTLAAQLATLPLISNLSGEISLISPVTNLLINLVQAPVMLLGGLATALGLVWLPLGQLAAWAAYPFLWWTVQVVKWSARVPHATVPGQINAAGTVLCYGLLLGLAWLLFRPERMQAFWGRVSRRALVRVSLFSAAVSLVLAVKLITSQSDHQLHVTFFDVGDGEAILIETPTGRRVLIDGGPEAAAVLSHLGQDLPLWERGLDLVIATQPEAGHANGLPAVLERYSVGALITNGAASGLPAWQALLELAESQGIPHTRVIRGQQIDMGDGVTLRVLHPEERLSGDQQRDSIVLQLLYGEVSFLLTGDADRKVEADLIQAGLPLESTVLKAADGGSQAATSQAFLEAVRPQLVVFAVGQGNPYRQPYYRVLERVKEQGCAILRTDQSGSITLITDGERLWIDTEKPEPQVPRISDWLGLAPSHWRKDPHYVPPSQQVVVLPNPVINKDDLDQVGRQR